MDSQRGLFLSTGTNAELDDLLEELGNRLQAGEPLDLGTLVVQHPQHAEDLRRYFPALQVLAGLKHTPEQLPALGELGDFRLLREVGRGGMGIVYEAEQISLRRRVALKVLPFAATMDPRYLQRFHNEAQAAACLHHTNIVPVHFVGCERGVHFYAMQFIDGQPLSELIAAQKHDLASGVALAPRVPAFHGALTRPRSPGAVTLPIAAAATQAVPRDAAHFRRIAEWGIQAAEGLEHAHSLGIVHRDIKPSNLMIDAAGKLWITDFGLARTSTDAGLTMTGDLVGTLRYMSPEQALAKHGLVDHRADVYSLGLTLYELLAGTPAIDGKDREEILNAITRDEPQPLRTLVPAIPLDLETIVLKAMAKEPAERYVTSRELAEDLRRFLLHEPIRAKRANILQRARKWAYRHKLAVEVAALVLVLVMVGLVFGTYLLWKKEAETRGALELVDKQRSLALANEKRANELRKQAELYLDRAFNDMRDLLKELDKKEFAEMPGIDKVRQKLASYVLDHYESYLDEKSPDPEVRHWTARAYQAVGLLQRDPRKGMEALIKSVTISGALTKEFPADARYWVRLGHHRFFLADYLVDQGLQSHAREEYRQAIEAFETSVRLAPEDARAVNNLAWHLALSDDPTIRNPTRAAALARRAAELNPDNWDTLGAACYHAGAWGEAVTVLERGLGLPAEKSVRADTAGSNRSDNKDTARAKFYLAMAYNRLGNIPKARLWYEQATEWMDKNAPQHRDLRRIRPEADALMGIRQQPPVQETQAPSRR